LSHYVRVDAMGFDVNTFCIEFSHLVIDLIEVSLKCLSKLKAEFNQKFESPLISPQFLFSIHLIESIDLKIWLNCITYRYYSRMRTIESIILSRPQICLHSDISSERGIHSNDMFISVTKSHFAKPGQIRTFLLNF
jgi:hypothetical protein